MPGAQQPGSLGQGCRSPWCPASMPGLLKQHRIPPTSRCFAPGLLQQHNTHATDSCTSSGLHQQRCQSPTTSSAGAGPAPASSQPRVAAAALDSTRSHMLYGLGCYSSVATPPSSHCVRLSGLLQHHHTPSSIHSTASALLQQLRNTSHHPMMLCVTWDVSA